jgi:hypothetical protein
LALHSGREFPFGCFNSASYHDDIILGATASEPDVEAGGVDAGADNGAIGGFALDPIDRAGVSEM